LRTAVRLDANNARAHYNLGVAQMNGGQRTEAADCFREVLRLQPLHADAHNNLGIIFRDAGRQGEAAQHFQAALRCNPPHAQVYNNLGLVYQDLERFAEAQACFEQSLRLQPRQADAYYNLGLLHKEQGHFEPAAAHFEQAIALDPGHKQALWNRCQMRLLQGDYERGLPEFELRWVQPGMVRRAFAEPRWDGSALAGKTILVNAEHGLGDTIHFVRYLPWVKRCGGRLVFECQPVLRRLLDGIGGADEVIAAGESLPPFDVHASLMSLPGYFPTPVSGVPADIPYLKADPNRVRFWQQELGRLSGSVAVGSPLNVGIVWQGAPTHPHDKLRSVPLQLFEILARQQAVRLISFQIGPGSEQLQSASFPVIDLGSRFDAKSMADVAAALTHLDLLISVDSALAHLAGAMGIDVWVAMPLVPDWRWLLQRADSPWYPTMRLFRQSERGDWRTVFERIAEELKSYPPGSANRG